MSDETVNTVSVVVPCYRDSSGASRLVHALRGQKLPAGWSCEAIVVDDGSGPPHAEVIRALADEVTRIIVVPENSGRSTAVARGIDAARGDLVMVIDSDCLPANADLLATHISALSDAKIVASNGAVHGHGEGFWSRYQEDVAERRAVRLARVSGTVGSTANSCMRRKAYLAAGGLDRSYRGYGFEDRDLLLRLATLGEIAWTPAAIVRHMDALTLPGVCRKIAEAGRGNAGLFAQRHPVAYRELGYARFDARSRPALAVVGRVLDPIVPRMAGFFDPLLDHLPFVAGRFLVKALSALSFLAGTSRALPSQAPLA